MKKLDNKLHMEGLGTDLIYQGRGGWSETIGHGGSIWRGWDQT